MASRPVSALEKYMRKNGLIDRDLADLVARHGVETSSEYIRFIRAGIKRPSLKVAKAISTACKKKVPILKIMEFKDTFSEWKSKAAKFRLKQ